MKKLAGATLVAASLVSPVFAADLPVKARPVAVAAPSWTGCYLGISAGANYGHTDGFITTDQTTLGNRPGTNSNPGVNFTGGFDVKLIPTQLFGLLQEDSAIMLSAAIDRARDYLGWAASLGIWH